MFTGGERKYQRYFWIFISKKKLYDEPQILLQYWKKTNKLIYSVLYENKVVTNNNLNVETTFLFADLLTQTSN